MPFIMNIDPNKLCVIHSQRGAARIGDAPKLRPEVQEWIAENELDVELLTEVRQIGNWRIDLNYRVISDIYEHILLFKMRWECR